MIIKFPFYENWKFKKKFKKKVLPYRNNFMNKTALKSSTYEYIVYNFELKKKNISKCNCFLYKYKRQFCLY